MKATSTRRRTPAACRGCGLRTTIAAAARARTGPSPSAGISLPDRAVGRPHNCPSLARRYDPVCGRRAVRVPLARGHPRRSADAGAGISIHSLASACRRFLLAPPIPLAGLVPDDHAAVQITVEHLADRRRRPAATAAVAAAAAHGTLGVVQLAWRSSGKPWPGCAQFEDAPHDGGFAVVDARSTCERLPSVRDVHVVVAEHAAAGDVARPAPFAASRRRCAAAPSRVRARRRTR